MAVARQMMPSHVERGRFGAGTTGCMGTGFPCKHSAMIPPFSLMTTCCHRRLVLRDGAVCDCVPCADAVGAKLARPEQQVVAILGDYAFGAACMEVETCIRWNIPVVIVLSNNAHGCLRIVHCCALLKPVRSWGGWGLKKRRSMFPHRQNTLHNSY